MGDPVLNGGISSCVARLGWHMSAKFAVHAALFFYQTLSRQNISKQLKMRGLSGLQFFQHALSG